VTVAFWSPDERFAIARMAGPPESATAKSVDDPFMLGISHFLIEEARSSAVVGKRELAEDPTSAGPINLGRRFFKVPVNSFPPLAIERVKRRESPSCSHRRRRQHCVLPQQSVRPNYGGSESPK
jgi:hypothetical protein